VRQNTTLLILNAGNYEYVCIRHRESQTLYISDVLHVPLLKDPGYGKIQVAIYITALQDALRRISLDSMEGGENTPVGVDVVGRSAAEVAVGSGWTTKAANTSGARRLSRGQGRPKKRQRTIDGLEEVRYYLGFTTRTDYPLSVVHTTGHLSTIPVGPPSL
jgi:hypothetical protein